MRLESDGVPDLTFGDGGSAKTHFGFSDNMIAIGSARQRDGKILVTGRDIYDDRHPSVMARYHPDGSLDDTFGTGGKIRAGGVDVAFQSTGKMIVADTGPTGQGTKTGFHFAILRSNGRRETGLFPFTLPHGFRVGDSEAECNAVAVDARNRILLAGRAESGGKPVFGLVRRVASGAIDPTFGEKGEFLTIFPGRDAVATCMAVLGNGKILVAGNAGGSGDSREYDSFALSLHEGGGVMPDARVGLTPDKQRGNNVYKTRNGQSQSVRVPEGGSRDVWITIQNDDDKPDAFTIKAKRVNPVFKVRYFHDEKDVTALVTEGSLETRRLKKGETQRLKVRITGRESSGFAVNFEVRVRSKNDPDGVDSVFVEASSVER